MKALHVGLIFLTLLTLGQYPNESQPAKAKQRSEYEQRT